MKKKSAVTFFVLLFISVVLSTFSSAAPAVFGNAVTPATGDNSHTVVWLVVFVLSLIALVFTIYSMHKHKPIK